VLRRSFGAAEVMPEQLGHLAEEAEHDRLTLVVLPTARGHAGLDGKFELVESDDAEPAVFLEGAARDHLERDPRATARYRQIADDLIDAGVGGAAAVALVRQAQAELGS
jgi:hypothetical protein